MWHKYKKKKKQAPGGQNRFPDWILKVPGVIKHLSKIIVEDNTCENNMRYVNNRAKQIVAFQRKMYQEKRDFYKRLLSIAWDRYNRHPSKANLDAMNKSVSELKEYMEKRKN